MYSISDPIEKIMSNVTRNILNINEYNSKYVLNSVFNALVAKGDIDSIAYMIRIGKVLEKDLTNFWHLIQATKRYDILVEADKWIIDRFSRELIYDREFYKQGILVKIMILKGTLYPELGVMLIKSIEANNIPLVKFFDKYFGHQECIVDNVLFSKQKHLIGHKEMYNYFLTNYWDIYGNVPQIRDLVTGNELEHLYSKIGILTNKDIDVMINNENIGGLETTNFNFDAAPELFFRSLNNFDIALVIYSKVDKVKMHENYLDFQNELSEDAKSNYQILVETCWNN